MSERFDRIRDMLAAAGLEKDRQTNAHRVRSALMVSTVLALLLLAWSTWDHIRTRLERERALAVQTTGLAAEKLTERLQSNDSPLIGLTCTELCPEKDLPISEGHRAQLVPGPSIPPESGTGIRVTDEPGKAMAEVPVGDTGWVLIDRLDAEHVSAIIFSRLTLGLSLGAAFLLAMLALYRLVRAQRRSALKDGSDLRESRLKLQAVLSATTDGIILANLQGRIELFNPAAEMMFGRLTEDVLCANLFKLLPDFFSSENTDALVRQQNADNSPPLVRETRGQRKGGKDFPVRLWVNGVRFDEEPHLLIVVQDLTEHERDEEHLTFLEQRDLLTGLLNRREFEQRLTAILADPKRSPDTLYVLCHVDVDRFNLINDTCGHEAGDELLKQLATLIKPKLAVADLVGRLGGDEFVVLFQNRTVEEAGEICDGLTQTVRSFLFTWRDQSFDVAISIGLVEVSPATESPSSALSKADVACHMAKVHGRDRIHIYHQGDAELVRHHGDMHLVSAISRALSEGRFNLYAQPITPIASTSTEWRHFEILVRMVDESGAAINPDEFIPAAERYILMPAVDRWIISRLFSLQAENLRKWHHMEPASFLFAVNLSGTSITDEGFLRYLKRQFTDWDVPYQSICFEITETAAVSDLEHARAFMQELSAMGCSFALDDFGTGLSSYRYLRELPVDYIKIDGSFVRGMSEDPVNYALVESITQISHVLGLQTIAEWAEDQATLTQLRALNVDFAQGFGIGEPMPVCNLTLADAAIPPSLEGTSDERRRSTHRPRHGNTRPS